VSLRGCAGYASRRRERQRPPAPRARTGMSRFAFAIANFLFALRAPNNEVRIRTGARPAHQQPSAPYSGGNRDNNNQRNPIHGTPRQATRRARSSTGGKNSSCISCTRRGLRGPRKWRKIHVAIDSVHGLRKQTDFLVPPTSVGYTQETLCNGTISSPKLVVGPNSTRTLCSNSAHTPPYFVRSPALTRAIAQRLALRRNDE
jgi:hypothetical protein